MIAELFLLEVGLVRFMDNLNAVISLLSNTDGRDKLAKTTQYICKLMVAIAESKYTYKHTSKSIADEYKDNIWFKGILDGLKNIAKSLSMARRVFRFGNGMKSIQATRVQASILQNSPYTSHMVTFFRICELVSSLFSIASCYFDDLGWFQGVWDGKSSKRVENNETNSDKCWAISCCFDILLLMRDMIAAYSDRKSWNEKKFNLVLQFIKLHADLMFAVSSGWKLGTDSRIMASGGLTSGSIGLYKAWQKVKK